MTSRKARNQEGPRTFNYRWLNGCPFLRRVSGRNSIGLGGKQVLRLGSGWGQTNISSRPGRGFLAYPAMRKFINRHTILRHLHTHTHRDAWTDPRRQAFRLSSSLPPSFFHHSFVRSFGKSFTGLLAKNYYPSKYSSRITTTGKYSYGQGLILQADTSVG